MNRLLADIAQGRPDDLAKVALIICRSATWAAVAGRVRERADAIEIAIELLEERARVSRA